MRLYNWDMIGSKWRCGHLVPQCDKVGHFFMFLCKDVRQVNITCNVFYMNYVIFHCFSDSILSYGDMAQSFCCCSFIPVDTGNVIIENGDGFLVRHVEMYDTKVHTNNPKS